MLCLVSWEQRNQHSLPSVGTILGLVWFISFFVRREKYCRTTCCNTIPKLCSVKICVVLLIQYCLPNGVLVCFMLYGWIILDGFFKERFGLVLVPWLSWLERCFRARVVRYVTGSNPVPPPHISFENEYSSKKIYKLT